MTQIFDLETYNYTFPEELIAQEPLAERTASRLLLREKNGEISDRNFSELDTILQPGSLVILNQSKVIPCRLHGNLKTGGAIEIFLLQKLDDGQIWQALGRPLKKLKKDTIIYFADGLEGKILSERKSPTENETIAVEFNLEEGNLHSWLEENGYVPLPPYIQRREPVLAKNSSDKNRYQTVFANSLGSVAAPTAGLHFSRDLLDRLKKKDIAIEYLTLHVGAGTFLPIKSDDIRAHEMHEELFSVSSPTFQMIQRAIAEKRPIVAVGTTTFRALQSFAAEGAREENCDKILKTKLFIHPTDEALLFEPWAVSGLITNFHQPKSTLLLLISALLGLNEMKRCYRHAIENRYRLFSYGDSCLFWL